VGTIYAHKPGLVIRKSDQSIVVTEGGRIVAREPVLGLDSIVIMGNSQITEQALRFAVTNDVSIVHANQSGQIIALTHAFSERGSRLRMLQYLVYSDGEKRLRIAKHYCIRKLDAQEAFLKQRRSLPFAQRHVFRDYREQVKACASVNQVLGVEGDAARFYFDKLSSFSLFRHRSRRPATDVMNALLNLAYSLVLHRICSALIGKGLDAQIGFLHAHNDRRPSLGLDLLEPYRARVDAFVVTITNRKEFNADDFHADESTGGMYLGRQAFARFLSKFNESLDLEREIATEVQRLCSLLVETAGS